MNVDLSRLPAGTAGWLSLVSFALELGDLAEVDYLELKGALSFASRQERKRSAVVLSRAILGMANRMPDVAEKHLSGSGVVLVGIDHSQGLVGVESVDAAILRDLIDDYVGEDGPTWDHQYIKHADGLVLALIVDPPQWGDRIHACRRDYSDDASKLSVRDGEVLVRVPGMTRCATSHDLAELERRRGMAPNTGAELSVRYVGEFDRTSRTNVRELIHGMARATADELIDGVPGSEAGANEGSAVAAFLGQAAGSVDRRNAQHFRADVEQWQCDCLEVTDGVITEFLRHTLGHGTFVISNESDRYLENVRVEVAFPHNVMVLMASETDYCDHGGPFDVFRMLPDPPAKYGALRPYGLDVRGLVAGRKPLVPNLPAPKTDVRSTPSGCVVSWHVGDLPPRAEIAANEKFAVFTDEALGIHNQGGSAGGSRADADGDSRHVGRHGSCC